MSFFSISCFCEVVLQQSMPLQHLDTLIDVRGNEVSLGPALTIP